MTFRAVVRISVVAFALLAAIIEGYKFAEINDLSSNPGAKEEPTGLTINEESRIFGGSDAGPSEYPFIVSLRKDTGGGKTYCGGSLVASQYVVTAAHCVKTAEATIYASIGSAFGSGLSSGQQIKVIKGYRHPMYNKSAHMYDVGVLKLEKAVPIKPIKLAAIDESDNKVGRIATAAGWGLTEKGPQSLVLQNVDVQIVSNAECNKQYNNRIKESMLCAGTGNGKDSCSGDSGGPLIANDVLVGIVSWGGKCGVKSGVYTRVSYMHKYIDDIVNGGDGSTFVSRSISEPSAVSDESGARTIETLILAIPGTETPTVSPSLATTNVIASPMNVSTGAMESPIDSPIVIQHTLLTNESKNSSTNDTEHIKSSSSQAEQSVPTASTLPSLLDSSTKPQYSSNTKCTSQFY